MQGPAGPRPKTDTSISCSGRQPMGVRSIRTLEILTTTQKAMMMKIKQTTTVHELMGMHLTSLRMYRCRSIPIKKDYSPFCFQLLLTAAVKNMGIISTQYFLLQWLLHVYQSNRHPSRSTKLCRHNGRQLLSPDTTAAETPSVTKGSGGGRTGTTQNLMRQ
jgi:hypothetical protein